MFDIPNASNYFAIDVGGQLMRLYSLNSDLDCDATQVNWLTNDLELYTGTSIEPYWKAIQYHLFHERPDRESEIQKSKSLFQSKREKGYFYCENGISQLVQDFNH
jgi:hypothetical protein